MLCDCSLTQVLACEFVFITDVLESITTEIIFNIFLARVWDQNNTQLIGHI